MANRTYQRDQYNSDAGVTTLFAALAFNGSSAPSLLVCNLITGNYTVAPAAGSAHFTKVVRNSTGNYTLTFRDTFLRILGINPCWISNSNAAAPILQLKVASDPTNAQAFGTNVGCGAVRTGTPIANFLTFSAQGTLADPGATELCVLEFVMQNSAATSGTS